MIYMPYAARYQFGSFRDRKVSIKETYAGLM